MEESRLPVWWVAELAKRRAKEPRKGRPSRPLRPKFNEQHRREVEGQRDCLLDLGSNLRVDLWLTAACERATEFEELVRFAAFEARRRSRGAASGEIHHAVFEMAHRAKCAYEVLERLLARAEALVREQGATLTTGMWSEPEHIRRILDGVRPDRDSALQCVIEHRDRIDLTDRAGAVTRPRRTRVKRGSWLEGDKVRKHAAELVLDGGSVASAAALVGRHRSTVDRWPEVQDAKKVLAAQREQRRGRLAERGSRRDVRRRDKSATG